MTIVRPCIVFGPNVDNYLVRLWTKAPFQSRLRWNLDQPIQFVHEDDVVEAISRPAPGPPRGAFNVAADGLMTMREMRRDDRHESAQDAVRLGRAIAG